MSVSKNMYELILTNVGALLKESIQRFRKPLPPLMREGGHGVEGVSAVMARAALEAGPPSRP